MTDPKNKDLNKRDPKIEDPWGGGGGYVIQNVFIEGGVVRTFCS